MIHDDPEVAAEVTEQTTPVGGSDADGELPRVGIPTVPVGILTVREVPSLESAPAAVPIAAGETVLLLSRSTARRRVHLSVTGVAVYLSNTSAQAAVSQGFLLPTGIVWSPALGSAVYAHNPDGATTAEVTYWAELDAG